MKKNEPEMTDKEMQRIVREAEKKIEEKVKKDIEKAKIKLIRKTQKKKKINNDWGCAECRKLRRKWRHYTDLHEIGVLLMDFDLWVIKMK